MGKHKAEVLYDLYKKKNRRTKANYIALNVMIFAGTAFMVVLNLFIVRLSEVKHDKLITTFFVATSVLSAIATLLATLVTFFKYKHQAKEAMKKTKDIKFLWETYKAKINQFSDPETRDLILVEQVTDILNRTNY